MTEVILEVEAAQAEAVLNRTLYYLKPASLAYFLEGIAVDWLSRRAQSRFRNEGDDVVGEWLPLAPVTQNIRQMGPWAVGPDHPINIRTHQLENYIVGRGVKPVANAGQTVTMLEYPNPSSLANPELLTKVETAQHGAVKPRTPARPVLGINVNDATFLTRSLAEYITGASFI